MLWIQQFQSANWSHICGIAVSAYLLGCFATGYYLVRWRTGQDIRALGSGNVGARNVGRVLGAGGFGLTLLGDFAKGVLAVWAARHCTQDEQLAALALLAVTSGHIWPVQLGFRGGKGVATALGALLTYDPHLAVTFAILFVGGFAWLRKTVLPGLFAFACLPLAAACLGDAPGKILSLSFMAALVLVAHRRNVLAEFSFWFAPRNVDPKQHPPTL